MRTPILLIFCVFFFAAPGYAQETVAVESNQVESNQVDWEQRVIELKKWIDEYVDWKAWSEKYRNKPEPGWVGFRERRVRPSPPAWLVDDCASLIEAEGVLGEACLLLADWKNGGLSAAAQRQLAAARAQREAPTKTVWWEHVHLDAFWPMPQWRTSVYGVVGMHATVAIAGRFQVFVAPGAILINLPGSSNTREWQPAADWGVAYRLADFRFPGSGQWATLHFNFAKAWILVGEPAFGRSSIELAGFSFTFKKTPK